MSEHKKPFLRLFKVAGKSIGAGLATSGLARTRTCFMLSRFNVSICLSDTYGYSALFFYIFPWAQIRVNALKSQTFLTKRSCFNQIFHHFYPGSGKGAGLWSCHGTLYYCNYLRSGLPTPTRSRFNGGSILLSSPNRLHTCTYI